MNSRSILPILAELIALSRAAAKEKPLLAAGVACVVIIILVRLVIGICGLLLSATPSNIGLVSGTVTIDGRPAAGVQVRFEPVSGGAASLAVTDNEGRYDLQRDKSHRGALIGDHRVRLTTGAVVQEAATSEKLMVINERLPERYNVCTELRAEVKRGRNEYKWECVSQK